MAAAAAANVWHNGTEMIKRPGVRCQVPMVGDANLYKVHCGRERVLCVSIAVHHHLHCTTRQEDYVRAFFTFSMLTHKDAEATCIVEPRELTILAKKTSLLQIWLQRNACTCCSRKQ